MIRTYAYKCTSCENDFVISHDDEIYLLICPFCGKDTLLRDYKAERVNFQLNSKGFYASDNRVEHFDEDKDD